MYRLLPILKDSYITNKIIAGSGSTTSNVGQAGTLDLFKIYTNPISSSNSGTIELTRILLKPDISALQALTSSLLNPGDSSFKTFLRLKDVYGGQTTPSNFTVSILPLARDWDEGRGMDIRAFRDLDAVNWLTASVSTGTPALWAVSGASLIGNSADTSVDVWVSGNLGSGSGSLEAKQTFTRGDEDLLVDVTTLVSATLVGTLPNYGWRITLSGTLETDTNTYFVKRFGSRHTTNKSLHPKVLVYYDDSLRDDGNVLVFGNVTNTLRTYNSVQGSYSNWVSGSTSITGSACARLHLVSSKSVSFQTSSYFQNFSGTITYTSSSMSYYSASFLVSQSTIGGLPITGYYQAGVSLNPQTDSSLFSFLGNQTKLTFQSYWKSLDGNVLYSSGSWLTVTLPQTEEEVTKERNFVVNITNLKNEYTQNEVVRLRVFIQDRNTEQAGVPYQRLPSPAKSFIPSNMYWRVLDAFSRDVIIPFHTTGTKLSTDGRGLYFDLYLQDLDLNRVFDIEFQITENSRNYYIISEGFRFKVIP